MSSKTITLRSDLVDRLQEIASSQGRSVDDVVETLLEPPANNWALAVAEAMEAEDIDWQDEPDLSTNSRANYEQHIYEQWKKRQEKDGNG